MLVLGRLTNLTQVVGVDLFNIHELSALHQQPAWLNVGMVEVLLCSFGDVPILCCLGKMVKQSF